MHWMRVIDELTLLLDNQGTRGELDFSPPIVL